MSPTTPLLEVIEMLLTKDLSSVPVTRDGRLVNVLSKSDIVFCALHTLIVDELVFDDEQTFNEMLGDRLHASPAPHLEVWLNTYFNNKVLFYR